MNLERFGWLSLSGIDNRFSCFEGFVFQLWNWKMLNSRIAMASGPLSKVCQQRGFFWRGGWLESQQFLIGMPQGMYTIHVYHKYLRYYIILYIYIYIWCMHKYECIYIYICIRIFVHDMYINTYIDWFCLIHSFFEVSWIMTILWQFGQQSAKLAKTHTDWTGGFVWSGSCEFSTVRPQIGIPIILPWM